MLQDVTVSPERLVLISFHGLSRLALDWVWAGQLFIDAFYIE